jgi:hypothetical protein
MVERSWGIYGTLPRADREKKFALTAKMYKQSPWYTKLEGGESRYEVSQRFRDFQGTLHREGADKRVLVVTHGDLMGIARYNIERMLPEQFEEMENDKSQTMKNCTILHYSRRNPRNASEVRDKLSWRRIVNPTDIETSPFGGEWVELPRVLLPESPEPFCLFLDELPACAPDIQKAFYSLLLERRIGEHKLPAGSWVVAAGNRAEDRALVRALSSALVNRVAIINVRVDLREWLIWARANHVRSDIQAFINFQPEALARPVPAEPVPFSTPALGRRCRAPWISLNRMGFWTTRCGARWPSEGCPPRTRRCTARSPSTTSRRPHRWRPT